jgi:hypothetical protein
MPDWTAVLSNDFAVPPRAPMPDLVDELCVMLASPVPEVRDDTAYPILAIWTARGVLDGQLGALGDRMAERLGADETKARGTPTHEIPTHEIPTCEIPTCEIEIQARTFAAMILGWVVLRDARTGELAEDRVPRWRTTFAGWWRAETDLRAWDPRLGWLHAVAHGADALRAFGRSPRLGVTDLRGLLDLAVDRLLVDAGYLFEQNEDDRIAYALASVLSRAELPATHATAWLDRVHAALEAGAPGPVPPWASNTLRTLGALYVFADRGVRWYDPDTGGLGGAVAMPHATAIKDRIAPILQLAWRGLG